MGHLLAEVGVPGVGVRVELEQRQRPVALGCGADERQGDRVVAAEPQHARPAMQLAGRLEDRGVRALDADRRRGRIARVDDLHGGERATSSASL